MDTQEMKMFTTYLQAHNIPPRLIRDIRMAMLNDAIQQSNGFKYDRIYSCIALALHNVLGFGCKRIIKVLKEFDRISGAINQDDVTWNGVMKELREKTGIVVHTDEKNRLVLEYDERKDEQ